MIALKQKYFILINSIKDINLKNIKKKNKFNIIYRNDKKNERFDDLITFRKKCKIKGAKFFVANDLKLCSELKSDGIYLSSYNKTYKPGFLKRFEFEIIGSAHNSKEIHQKRKQNCQTIIVSKLFKVDYEPYAKSYGIVKFNNLINASKEIIPLGGIKIINLNKLKTVRSNGLALMTEIKKKPAISSRLF